MSVADKLRQWIEGALIGKGYRVQFGAWRDGGNTSNKYAVLRPTGGLPQSLVRTPKFSLMLIGAINQDATQVNEVAEQLIQSVIADWNSGGVTQIECEEPTFYQSADSRPIFEISISVIDSI